MIAVGDLFPDVTLKTFDGDGAMVDQSTATLFTQGRSVLFGLPGAFTPTCSTMHLPGYVKARDRFQATGVDCLACLSVNDAFVMRAWAESLNVLGTVAMLADGNGTLTRALGLDTDASAFGMGLRAQRFAMTLDAGRVSGLFVEAPGEYRVSDAEYVLRQV
ncbi:peroxiredoxin [Magnetospira sp. QH-2]|uniref:peroxiredoxin n=1 Tax=Magnetospira sp. (strain QH-2) TaxID=1288970 RepID=UPI0003E81558|nr:peroxiredoxin [Magnetospira sp. QH-2]CCQ74661.1 peroxiredoxin [Magnetospira sp. QH-2]